MPIYVYRCVECGHTKDVLQKLSDPVLTVCPACGAPAFGKQLTAAGFQLKGTGWYASDFKDKTAAKRPADGEGAAEGKAAIDGKPPAEGKPAVDGKPAADGKGAAQDAPAPASSAGAPAAATPAAAPAASPPATDPSSGARRA